MKKIELTQEQKQKLNKVNLYLAATFIDGIYWDLYVNNEEYIDGESLDGPTPSGEGGWKRRDQLDFVKDSPGLWILQELATEITNKYVDEINEILSCDDCGGSGHFYINYDGETQTFSANIEASLRLSEQHDYKKTFDEWAKTEPTSPWIRLDKVKKLSDPEFIEKYKNETEDGIIELQYNGYGDSGQIDEPTDIPQEIEYLGYEIIDIYFSGWENNEGADGTIVINFNEKTISIYHLNYYEENENYELEEYQLV